MCVCNWTTNHIELGALSCTCKHFRLLVSPVNSNELSVNVLMLSSPGAVALPLHRCPRYVVRRDWIDCLSVVRGWIANKGCEICWLPATSPITAMVVFVIARGICLADILAHLWRGWFRLLSCRCVSERVRYVSLPVTRPVIRYFTPLGLRNVCPPRPLFVRIQLCSVKFPSTVNQFNNTCNSTRKMTFFLFWYYQTH